MLVGNSPSCGINSSSSSHSEKVICSLPFSRYICTERRGGSAHSSGHLSKARLPLSTSNGSSWKAEHTSNTPSTFTRQASKYCITFFGTEVRFFIFHCKAMTAFFHARTSLSMHSFSCLTCDLLVALFRPQSSTDCRLSTANMSLILSSFLSMSFLP